MKPEVEEVRLTPIDRRSFLGGTDIASLFEVSPWKTAYALWEEKTATEAPVEEIEPEREKRLRRGKKLEPWVLELLEEERGIFVQKRNQRYTDREHSFMSCEIDFEYMDDLGVCNGDIKTISPFAAGEWGQEGTDEIPLYYCLQFMWGLMITERPKTLVAAMIGADDMRVYEVRRDEDLIGEIRGRAVTFWRENIERGIPPPPENVRDTHKILAKYGGFVSPGNEQVWHSIRRLKGIKAAQSRLDKVKDQYEMDVKRFLVIEAEVAQIVDAPKKFQINGPDGKKMATLAMQHRSGYTVQPTDFLVLRT